MVLHVKPFEGLQAAEVEHFSMKDLIVSQYVPFQYETLELEHVQTDERQTRFVLFMH